MTAKKIRRCFKKCNNKKLAVARSRGCIIKNQIIGITYYKLVLREKPLGCSGFYVEKYGGRWKTGSLFKFFIMATMKVCVHNSWFITLITVNTLFFACTSTSFHRYEWFMQNVTEVTQWHVFSCPCGVVGLAPNSSKPLSEWSKFFNGQASNLWF